MRQATDGQSRRAGDEGFTLIELVVAMLIFAIMAVSVVAVVMQAQGQAVSNRNRIAASNLAAREIDMVRREFAATDAGPVTLANAGFVENPHQLTGGANGAPLVVDGTEYTVTRNAVWKVSGSGASACEGGAIVAYPSLGVEVTVTWPNMGVVQPVEMSTALAPGKENGAATTDSFIAAKVVDQDGLPLTGIQVTATASAVAASAYTDDSGCAVIRVTPATSGTSYTVKVADASYVDISGNHNPSKLTGNINRGALYAGASFAVALPGTVQVHLVRADGGPLTDAQVAGAGVTLIASESSGSTGTTVRTATGVTTSFTGLWPTTYGAYFGSTAPTGGYAAGDLPPGGSVTIDVEFAMATVDVTQLPPGTTSVRAVVAGTATTCASGQGTDVPVAGPSAPATLMPGSYDLYAVGTGFACSPGPMARVLASGDNTDIAWGTTTLQLTGVPTGGTVWALDTLTAGFSTLATCPGGAGAAAINVDSARAGAVPIAPGSWFIYQTTGAATAGCASFPGAINPTTLTYGAANTRAWTMSPTTLTLTNMTAGLYLVVGPQVSTSCTSTTVYPNTATWTSSGAGAAGSPLQASVSVPRPSTGTTTYYAYQWTKSGTPKCTAAGTFVVGPGSSTLTKTAAAGSVGP